MAMAPALNTQSMLVIHLQSWPSLSPCQRSLQFSRNVQTSNGGEKQHLLRRRGVSRHDESRGLCVRAIGEMNEDMDRDRKLLSQHHEIRVCINKTCRKSGSLETLDFIRSLAPPNVTVESCSCIGKNNSTFSSSSSSSWIFTQKSLACVVPPVLIVCYCWTSRMGMGLHFKAPPSY